MAEFLVLLNSGDYNAVQYAIDHDLVDWAVAMKLLRRAIKPLTMPPPNHDVRMCTVQAAAFAVVQRGDVNMLEVLASYLDDGTSCLCVALVYNDVIMAEVLLEIPCSVSKALVFLFRFADPNVDYSGVMNLCMAAMEHGVVLSSAEVELCRPNVTMYARMLEWVRDGVVYIFE